MTIDHELLRKAWPEGLIAQRGVTTVEGWVFSSHCVIFSEHGLSRRRVSPRTSVIIHHPAKSSDEVQGWIDDGDLLPNVNPLDTATWACLLRDLAIAASGLTFNHTGLDCIWERRGACWMFSWRSYSGFQGSTLFTFHDPIEDPALALVLARIQLRQQHQEKEG